MDLLQALDRTRDETLRHFELGLLGDIEGELLPGHHEAAHALANGRVIANQPERDPASVCGVLRAVNP